jgi:formylglycine-generating enzyme required for sulfatase activity
MGEPNGSDSEQVEEKEDEKGQPRESRRAPGAIFQSVGGAPSSRPRGRLAGGLIVGGGILLGGLYWSRAHRADATPPPPPTVEEVEPPPPEDGPPLPLDAVVQVQGGTFTLGSTDGDEDERPVTETKVATFELDLTEATVAAYRACVDAGKCTPPDTGLYCNWDKPGRDRHPVNCIDWQQASAYCAFAGKRLPTEQEWEYAARGPDGRKYPWKDGHPSNQLCWNGEGNDLGKSNRQGTCAVGRYPAGASPFGAFDMAGNVWEWTAATYCPSYDGKGCVEDRKVIRGGAWNNLKAEYVRAQDRSKESATAQLDNVGFRCARTRK